MNVMNASTGFLALSLATFALAGCRHDDDWRHGHRGSSSGYYEDEAVDEGNAPAPSDGAAPPNAVAPMLVEVDPDQTMNAVGGEGVGVFVEYGSGGHWHVWWTCDTAHTSQSCDFAVAVSTAPGALSNVDITELAGGFLSSTTTTRIDARSTTTTEVNSLRFDTDPGAVITVEASVGGIRDGAFVFFVQDGQVNGGFTGVLTNPLQLQGKTP